MQVAFDGEQAPATPPSGVGPSQMDLVTPRQPPPVGPARPSLTPGFGGPLSLREPCPSPAPFSRQVRLGNH